MPKEHGIRTIAVIKGSPIKEPGLREKIKEKVLDIKAKKAAQLLLFDRQPEPYFLARNFLRNVIKVFDVSPKVAAQILWSVVGGEDSYTIADKDSNIYRRYFHEVDGISYLRKVNDNDWYEGVLTALDPELYASTQVSKTLVGVTTGERDGFQSEEFLYLVNMENGAINLDRVFSLPH